jgi:hypothetical protein
MPREREPRPTDLLGARDLVDLYGLPLRTAENIVRKVARAHGGPIQVEGVRRIFVERSWVESSIGQRS